MTLITSNIKIYINRILIINHCINILLKALLKSSPFLLEKLLILEDFSTQIEPPDNFFKTSDISILQIFLEKEQIPQKFGGTLKTFKQCNLELSSAACATSQISTASSASNGKSFNLTKFEKIKSIQENKTKIKEIEDALPSLEKEIEKSRNIIKTLENQIEILHNIDYKSQHLEFDQKKIENSEVLRSLREYENAIRDKGKKMKKKLT